MSSSQSQTSRAQHDAPRGQKNAGTECYELSDEDVVPAKGFRPRCLGEPPAPQDQDQQRTVEQTADYAPMVQILDTPVPQMVDQLVAVLSPVDSLVPEQVIAVPKISWPSRFTRTVLREPQKAEQLVEAPTLVSVMNVFEHTVDIPVGAGGLSGNGGLQVFSPGQSSSLAVDQIVDIPVPGRSSGFGGLQGLHAGQSSTAVAAQNVDIPAPRGGHQGFHPDHGSIAFFPDPHGDAFQGRGGGSHFSPAEKSALVASHPGDFWEDEDGDMWMRLPSGPWCCLARTRTSAGTSLADRFGE